MTAPVDYAVTDFASNDSGLVLYLNGRAIPIVQYSAVFALNSIPQAMVIVGTGYDAYDVSQAAPITDAIPDLLNILPAQVVFSPGGDYSPDGTPWPPDPIVIFDGYFVGASFLKSASGKLSMAIQLIHWLSDMAFSSCLSRQSHPASARDLTFNMSMASAGAGAGPPSQPANLPDFIDDKALTQTISTDLWSAVKDFFYKLANADLIYLPGCGATNPPLKNSEAQGALDRMPGGEAHPYKGGTPNWYSPLQLTASGLGQALANKAALHLRSMAARSMWQTTFWDTLIGQIGPLFKFSIVPRVQTALAVAITPGLQATWRKPILQNEIYSIDSNATIYRPLKAVAIHASGMSWAGASRISAPSLVHSGCFVIPDLPKGMVLHQMVPAWMSDLERAVSWAGSSSGSATTQAIPSGTTAAVKPPPPPKQAQTPAQLAPQIADFYNSYAQMIYVEETLRGRFATLSGKLRFDIAPGSNVAVQANPNQFTNNQDALHPAFYGTVISVNVTLDAESRRGQTTFQLAHVRTEDENGSARTSATDNPIYGGAAFKGAPLVNEYLFG